MPQNKNVKIYDESWLKTIVEAQAGVTPDYDPKDTFGAYSRVIERQSADFLEDYIAGAAVPTAEASDLLPDYFAILRQSKYHRIVKSLKKAETKYKLEAISRHKEDEKKKAFQATRFKILNSKKEAALLSSKDMLLINSLEFFINSFNFCRGKRGVFLCTATGGRRGWQRKATGCQGLWRRVSGTAGSCGEPCADGPGLREAVCGRAAGASVRTGRGANRFSAWR